MTAARVDLHEISDQEHRVRGRYPWRVKVCSSTGCLSAGAQSVRDAIESTVAEDGLDADVQVVPTGCLGLCSAGPLVQVESRGDTTMYRSADAATGVDVARRHIGRGEVLDDGVVDLSMPFFSRQHRVVLANAGRIDPDRIEDYIAEGGYRGLVRAVEEMSPSEVVDEVRHAGLRGRGGAGYPTGTKWQLLAEADGDTKYVIANGDEGDPGAYMDRTVMEDDPHRVLEGLMIAAYATGASKAYVYVRAEYPRAVERLERAIRTARRHKLLGRSVLGSTFSLDVEVRIGAGAFVCGEETAMMASIMGRRGQPRPRPPYPTEHGLWGAPTMIDNVETLANVPAILSHGSDWYAQIGTPGSHGTKVFALAGDLVNTGLIEVPMGIPLREIVEDIGGGVPDGRAFKAAQTGGPSGGCIPSRHLDAPVDYESLRELGSIMGSGGLIVMDDRVRMPDVARYFMEFCRDESCGKCAPCRVGTAQLHGLLTDICEGRGRPVDLRRLESLCRTVRDTSLCGLGQTAPNPVFSTLEYFRSEYEDLLVHDEHRPVVG